MQELAFLAKDFETTVEANTNTVAHVLLDQKTGDINSMVDGIAEAGEFKPTRSKASWPRSERQRWYRAM